MKALTRRQRQILEFIVDHVEREGFPPTLREMGRHFGIRSPNGVRDHIRALERKGYIAKGPEKSRAIRLRRGLRRHRGIPLLGRIAAGSPILAEENMEGTLEIRDLAGGEGAPVFALHVRGDSMVEAGIQDGDIVLVRSQPVVEQGEIAACVLDEEATVKRLYREPHGYRLQPANEAMEPIFVEEGRKDFRVAGRVVGILRRL
jgi:repressor LexA